MNYTIINNNNFNKEYDLHKRFILAINRPVTGLRPIMQKVKVPHTAELISAHYDKYCIYNDNVYKSFPSD